MTATATALKLTPAQRRTLAVMIVTGDNFPDMRSAAALARLGLVWIADFGPVIGKMAYLTIHAIEMAQETAIVEEWMGGSIYRKNGINYTSRDAILEAAVKIAERADFISSIQEEARERLEAAGGDVHAALTALNVEERNSFDAAAVNRFYAVHAEIERIG